MAKNKERRFFETNVELRDGEGEQAGLIVGYPALFNSLSEDLGGFREKIAAGAFKRSLANGADVRALWNHDANYVLGRNKSGTLTLEEDAKGLRMVVDPPDTTWAEDLKKSMKRGDVNQMSFGFWVESDSWEMQGGQNIRTLEEVDIFDVSIVTYPAYPETSANVRSLFNAVDLEYETLAAIFARSKHGLEITDQDKSTIEKSIEVLRNLATGTQESTGADAQERNQDYEMTLRLLEAESDDN